MKLQKKNGLLYDRHFLFNLLHHLLCPTVQVAKMTGRNQALKPDETKTSPSLPPSKSSDSKQESMYFFAPLLLLAACSSECPHTT
jgi:hypothetical protein